MAEFTICPSNWDSFQHYKDRSPSWIKLHRSMILDNPKWHRLPTASKAIAPSIWLLASEGPDGEITSTMEDLAFRLRTSEKDAKTALIPLIEANFFVLVQDASGVLAECKQDASGVLAQRREEESREENRGDNKKSSKKETKPESRNIADEYCRSLGLPHYECEKFWDHWNNIQEWKDVKDWQSRARTWKNNFVRYGGKLATPESAKPAEVPFVSPWEDAG